MASDGSYRLGIDIGGTFTDFVLVDDERGDITLHNRGPLDADRCRPEISRRAR